jgi:DNA-binding Lrp family transcriptional regulator
MVSTLALVLIKTELGQAKSVAEALVEKGAACWAIVVTGPYDVVAAVNVENNEALGDRVIEEIQETGGIKNPTTLVGVYVCKGVDPFP